MPGNSTRLLQLKSFNFVRISAHPVEKQVESKFAYQQKQIEALTVGLQKVSAQLELSKPEPQTVLNNQ
jgi:hypothetical protein